MGYAAPVPPLTSPVATQTRVGGYDRHGTPQDILDGDVITGHVSSHLAGHASAARAPRRTSVPVAVLLAAVFGPLGLLYSSRVGAGFLGALFLLLVLPLSAAGLPGLAVLMVFPWCMLWALAASLGRNAGLALRAQMAAFPRVR